MPRRFFRKVGKYARRAYNSKAGKALRKVTGDRYGRGWKEIATKGVPQMMRDVKMLKDMVNAEKKRLDIVNYTPTAIGQVNANASAHFCLDITPAPAEGSAYAQRNGSSIKWTSLCAKFQMYQQSATTTPIKFKWYMIQPKGQTVTTSIVSSWFNSNQWVQASSSTSIYDFHSETNPDYYGTFNILRSGSFKLPIDQLSGQTMIKDFTIKHRFGKGRHVRFYGDTQALTHGQVFLLIFADTGNCSTTTASTLTPIVNQAINTGASFVYDIRNYYYDN